MKDDLKQLDATAEAYHVAREAFRAAMIAAYPPGTLAHIMVIPGSVFHGEVLRVGHSEHRPDKLEVRNVRTRRISGVYAVGATILREGDLE